MPFERGSHEYASGPGDLCHVSPGYDPPTPSPDFKISHATADRESMVIAMVLVFVSPRLAFAALYVFSNQARQAFPNVVVPAIGLVLLPWTTLSYTLAYEAGEISGLWWGLLVLGLFADVAYYREARVTATETDVDKERWSAQRRWPSQPTRR